jgi:integrase
VIKARTLKRTGKRVWDVRLRDPDGKVYNRTFATKKAAAEFEDSERTDRRRGAWVDPRYATMTVSELAAKWLASNPSKRNGTRARDETIIRRHIKPTLGPRPIGSVTQPDVQGLVNVWAKQAAPRTVKRQYDVVRAMFTFAVHADFRTTTPCRNVKLPQIKPLRRRLPGPDQLAALADELSINGLMLWVGVLTGLRWGEVAGIRVAAVDLLRGELKVVEQRTRDLDGDDVTPDDDVTAEPKSAAGVRTLSIPGALAAMFSEHMTSRGLTGADAEALVFVAERGGPLNYSSWRQRVWVPACERAGVAGLTFHDLRRCNATAMVADNVDLKTAQTRFGHSDPRLTIGLYAQAVTEANRQAGDDLAARFLPRDGRATIRSTPRRY